MAKELKELMNELMGGTDFSLLAEHKSHLLAATVLSEGTRTEIARILDLVGEMGEAMCLTTPEKTPEVEEEPKKTYRVTYREVYEGEYSIDAKSEAEAREEWDWAVSEGQVNFDKLEMSSSSVEFEEIKAGGEGG